MCCKESYTGEQGQYIEGDNLDTYSAEVIVSGAGPAGATVAYQLARSGASVLLLEKERLPRYKTCGGGITAKCARLLDFDISPVVERTIMGVTVTNRLAPAITWRSDEPLCYMVMRDRFDHLLVHKAQEAGARVLEGTTVKAVEVSDEGVAVTTRDGRRFQGRVVVGADGANGVVARNLGLAREGTVGIGLESEVRVASQDLDAWHDRVLLDMAVLKHGYGWIFPKADHLSIGVGGPSDDTPLVKQYSARFTNYCRSILGQYEVVHSQGHRLPVRPAGLPIHTQRGLLVGDAAGMVNPLDGEGIYYAISSGQIAATAILKALAGDAPLDFSEYQRDIDAQITVELHRAAQLVKIYGCAPWFFAWLIAHSSRLRSAILRLVRGEMRYSDIPASLGPLRWLLERSPT
ncbi:MAG: geranylgeranyl reductase family protein [Chloroflexota bacterium]|nr:geranylgeranyl reductase family protein [Chloroflexota bacterium]